MAPYSSSAAYDFSAFQPAQKQRPPQQPKLKVVGKPRRKASTVITPRMVSVFIMVVTLVGLIIYNQVCLNELTGEMNEIRAEIKVLESENIKLTSDLESIISLRTVAQRAKYELGMDRASKYQTEYIYLYSEDEIRCLETASSSQTAEKLSIQSIFGRLKEYIDAN